MPLLRPASPFTFGPSSPIDFGPVFGGQVNSTLRIVHQVWAERATRKAGMEMDEEHDVVIEVYASESVFGGKIRERHYPEGQFQHVGVDRR